MTSNDEEVLKQYQTLCDEWSKNARLEIHLDFPPADLFPNRASGKHWGSLYKTKSEYRESSTWLAKKQIQEQGGWKSTGRPIFLHLIFSMPDKRHRDADNCLAAVKGALDGLADALMVNDRLFNPIIISREPGTKPGKLIVKLEETWIL